MAIETIWRGAATLGEGPVWDAGRGVLWFVDIKQRHVHRLNPATGETRCWPAPAQIGWVLPAEGDALLAGLQTGLARFDPDTGAFEHLIDVEPDRPGNRLNDATVAPDGSVWFGSMDDGESAETGRVYRWNGRHVVDTGISPVCITNGPGISPDGRTLYHVDTVGGTIHAVDIAADARTGAARDFVRIDPAHGNPDGVTVDSAGNVWVGLWGGACARRYGPDGALQTEIDFPAANITKVALGGAGLATGFATSARAGLDTAALADQPEAGNLFAFAVDVPGQSLPLARLNMG